VTSKVSSASLINMTRNALGLNRPPETEDSAALRREADALRQRADRHDIEVALAEFRVKAKREIEGRILSAKTGRDERLEDEAIEAGYVKAQATIASHRLQATAQYEDEDAAIREAVKNGASPEEVRPLVLAKATTHELVVAYIAEQDQLDAKLAAIADGTRGKRIAELQQKIDKYEAIVGNPDACRSFLSDEVTDQIEGAEQRRWDAELAAKRDHDRFMDEQGLQPLSPGQAEELARVTAENLRQIAQIGADISGGQGSRRLDNPGEIRTGNPLNTGTMNAKL
jgi:hypothetical protein